MIKKYLDFVNENYNGDVPSEIMDLYNTLKSNHPDFKIELEDPYKEGTPQIVVYTYVKEGERWENKGLIISFEDDDIHYQELAADYNQDWTDRYEGYSDEAYDEGPVAVVAEFLQENKFGTEDGTAHRGEVPYVDIDDSIDVYEKDEVLPDHLHLELPVGSRVHKMKVYDIENEYDAGGEEFQNIYAETEDGRSAYVLYKNGRFELQWWNR